METQKYGLSLCLRLLQCRTKESSFRPECETRTSKDLFSHKMYIFLNFKKVFLLFYVCKCFKCVCVCAPTCVFGAFGDQRRVSGAPELELWTVVSMCSYPFPAHM